MEFGTKVWNQIFVPLTKTKVKEEKLKRFGKNGELYVSRSTGLIALTENRYKIFIFGKSTIACVYRLADVFFFDEETGKKQEGAAFQRRLLCRLREGLTS